MKKFLFLGLLPLILLLGTVTPNFVFAQYALAQAPSAQVLVEKKILNPTTSQFVDNLTVDQYLFLPNQEIVFKIDVRNNTTSDIKNITVKDVLPAQVNFTSGDGQYDKNSNTVTFVIDSLSANTTRSFQFKAQVKGAEAITSNVMCVSNLAQLSISGAAGMMSQDTANFCIQKQVLGVAAPVLPVTGPSIDIVLLSSLALFIYGVYLRFEVRKSQGGTN